MEPRKAKLASYPHSEPIDHEHFRTALRKFLFESHNNPSQTATWCFGQLGILMGKYISKGELGY